MATASRELVLKRRAVALEDFGSRTASAGAYTIDQALGANVLTYNAKMIVGIATETDVGLDPARHPYVCILANAAVDLRPVDLVVRYWPIVDATGAHIPFARRNEDIDRMASKLYAQFPDFDEVAWDIVRSFAGSGTAPGFVFSAAIEPTQDSFAQQLTLSDTLPAAAQQAQLDLTALFSHFSNSNQVPYLKLAANRYLVICPHGSNRSPAAYGTLSDQSVPAYEYFATRFVNYKILEERYPNAPKGMINLAASAIAYSHRYGLNESYQSREFNAIAISYVDNTHFTVNDVQHPSEVTPPSWINVGDTLDMGLHKFDGKIAEISGGACLLAGFQHYLFNHTTGGSKITGPLLGVLMMYKLYDPNAITFDEEAQTSLYYEALHPVSKRIVANISIKNCKVWTAGRSRVALPFEEVHMDTYLTLRSNIYPAGSHKAYLTLLVLLRVCDANLGVFLPWNSEMTSVVNTCKAILTGGARAHVGSSYYTGMPPLVQSGSLDAYLPDLAYYMQTLAKGDSLALSPHLGPNIAAAASTSWKNLINKVKSDDLSAADPEVVVKFLHATGTIRFAFDPNDQSTWAGAAQSSIDASSSIKAVLGV